MSVMTTPVTTDLATVLSRLADFLGVDLGGGWTAVDLRDPGVWERILPAVGGEGLEPRMYYVRRPAGRESDVTTERP